MSLLLCAGLSQLGLSCARGQCARNTSDFSASHQPSHGTSGASLLQFRNIVRNELLEHTTQLVSYDMCQGTYSVGGYTCGVPAGQDDTKVFFPCYQRGPGAFPVVVYGHGMGGRGEMDATIDAFRMVVELGIIVIAPYTNGFVKGSCTSKTEYQDLLRALRASEDNAALHKALPRVDWSRQAVWGYSMGGKTAPLAVKNFPDNRIKALVASHGARECDGILVPSLLLTSTRDDSSSPPEVMRSQFDSIRAQNKVFLNLQGAYHDEPQKAGRLNAWVGRFLACHLGLLDSCGPIYSAVPAVCQAQAFAPDGCLVRGGSPGAPAAPCTSRGADPYAAGPKVDCCGPLAECLGDHDASGRWFYKCLEQCAGAAPPAAPQPPSCTIEGADPYASEKKVACCNPLLECLGDHGTGGTWFYKCLASCPGT
eukprot:CAMPEP_0179091420 /NCGR_PEP_ID=MMETSP0796-20121207/41761_1 /TAXON_ID=73915 /ORGANISM="Pyrodinium bahamense, Strain pbaha01" /LENGTH=423 /DNA_ID=CAMNT_0020789011 /DNA_START=79 /DNA_END=1350 /DNA_ORIENTATION=+